MSSVIAGRLPPILYEEELDDAPVPPVVIMHYKCTIACTAKSRSEDPVTLGEVSGLLHAFGLQQMAALMSRDDFEPGSHSET